MTRVDLLYLACNRLAFTQETFNTLILNTDWEQIQTLFIIDDGSVDGTLEWLEANSHRVPAHVCMSRTHFGSPVTAMVHFIESANASILAKIDNDAMVPPGWLRQSLDVLDRHPELDLLGIEAMYPHIDDIGLPRNYTPAEYISGLGLYRKSVFSRSRPQAYAKYFGLEEWQLAQGRSPIRGWITPALSVFLLDRTPLHPWIEWSNVYIQRGWQRPWPKYAPDSTLWHWRWPNGIAQGSTGSFRRLNLSCCESNLEGFTNCDIFPAPGVDATNFQQKWPWKDNSVDYVRAWDFIEHLPDKVFTMNELWRVLTPGGIAEISVPTTDGSGAFQDPTHVSFWNRRSFSYYEDGNPYRERFVENYNIRAKFRLIHEHTDQTVDGPRLSILLEAIKPIGNNQGPIQSFTPPQWEPKETEGDSRYLCALRVKNESAHIQEVIKAALRLCGTVYVFDDHSTDETVSLCHTFGDRVKVFLSPFEGLDEARDKNYLLQHIISAKPEWVLWIDGDEILERTGPEKLARMINAYPQVAAFALRISYLWDDANHIRVDGIYGRFWRPSLFRLHGQRGERLQFKATHRSGNFHCGNVPHGLAGRGLNVEVRLKHYGYMTQEQRMAKYQWYRKIDPHNAMEDEYRHLAGIPGARHAPGPVQVIPWTE